MSFKLKKLESLLPPFFPALRKEVERFGMTLTLVGGVVRDFLLDDRLTKDWDVELSHEGLPWSKDLWKEFGKSLAALGKMNYLPYDVIRLELKGYTIEFSPPRREIFHENLEGHKNFTAEFDFKMPFLEAVKRRDFTINAMGLRFKGKEIEFLDPLEGLRHLREKLLHPCGPDFAKDPVRFLRALRFSWKYKMEISPVLKVELQTMRASGFSASYLWSEMLKSGDPLGFYFLLVKWKAHHLELTLPVGEEILPRYEELKKILKHPGLHESWIIALEWVGIDSEPWQKYFNLSAESQRRLARWARETKAFQRLMPEAFHGEFEEVRERPEFLTLFDWYFTTKQLLQKSASVELLKIIEECVPEWALLYRFEPVKDVKHIDPPFRAKYQVWNLCQRL